VNPEKPIRFVVGRSVLAVWVALAFFALGFVCLMLSAIDPWLQAGCALLLTAWLAFELYTAYLHTSDAFTLVLDTPRPDDIGTIVIPRGVLIERDLARAPDRGLVVASSVVTPLVVIVHYQRQSDRWVRAWFPRVLVVWVDAMDADEFRRLRVVLKHA
jgi:ABC-type uncharacterized transport system fused permease/ATPase subunit